jgi:hypothetical protein
MFLEAVLKDYQKASKRSQPVARRSDRSALRTFYEEI